MLDVLYKIDTNIKSQIQPLTMKIKTYSYFYPDYIDKYSMFTSRRQRSNQTVELHEVYEFVCDFASFYYLRC
jgi:hypothetical protein